MDTPLCDFVRGYAESGSARLHMPGHKGKPFLGPEALDLTEIPGADVLYHEQGVIAQSEANASALFGSALTLYSAEGSTLCVKAMLYLALQYAHLHGKKPLIAAGRNAHRSFLSGAALLGLEVFWLWGEAEEFPLSCTVTPAQLERVLREEKPAAVYLTSPDYLGNRADIAALAALCHAHGALLLVDNAHGAYLKFLSPSEHPLDLGADVCCDSAHKTLPVLTGGAYLHLSHGCPEALRGMARQAMRLFAGTSPSYLILQSLDLCNRLLSGGYDERLRLAAARLDALKDTLCGEGWLLAGDEPLKLTLRPKGRGYTGTELAALLEKQGIFCEFADPDYLVCMVSPATDDADLEMLLHALRTLPARAPKCGNPHDLLISERVLPPREALLAPFETLPAEGCLGRVLAAPTVSCPPAVPILVAGERIDESALALFAYYGIETLDVISDLTESHSSIPTNLEIIDVHGGRSH